MDSVRSQLRIQATEIDRFEAQNAEQQDVIKSLRTDIARLQAIQSTDAQDIVHLAGRLLAHSQATGAELDNATKALFRRRGWTTTTRDQNGQEQ